MMEVSAPPIGLEEAHKALLTEDARQFLSKLVMEFDPDVEQMLRKRRLRKLNLDMGNTLPDFNMDEGSVGNKQSPSWSVWPVPRRLQCRHLDLGDVSPTNDGHFVAALRSSAQGIQTDFDDGHCPSWGNQLHGLYNVYKAVNGLIKDVPSVGDMPVLMLRPRAWNMWEKNVMVNGRIIPGPLFDFGLLMFHLSQKLVAAESGPFFYLSKLEGANEATLWNRIFVWTQDKLGLPLGTIKACVLIENVLAAFEAEDILYALRQHSAGLNCGIWDYAASFINKFGNRREFVLPDRSKYVSMSQHFLRSYMDLVVQICHRHRAHATGGMAALVLPPCGREERQQVMEAVIRAKSSEIQAGVDGFMVYDIGLLAPMQKLFQTNTTGPNQIHKVTRSEVKVTAQDLLKMPSGGVTFQGLQHNIAVGILFIEAWLNGAGHYIYKGCVEDSATAEISRSQVWQWLRHGAALEENNQPITMQLIKQLIKDFLDVTMTTQKFGTDISRQRLGIASDLFEQLVTKRDFPEFITSYLYEEQAFLDMNAAKKYGMPKTYAKL